MWEPGERYPDPHAVALDPGPVWFGTERCANLCFGGRYRNRLFMAASHSLHALYVGTQGAGGVWGA
jgi:sugar lactone lactonase YvrE